MNDEGMAWRVIYEYISGGQLRDATEYFVDETNAANYADELIAEPDRFVNIEIHHSPPTTWRIERRWNAKKGRWDQTRNG